MRQIPKWSEYFIEMAHTAAIRSKDPSTQVGSVVVSKDNRVLGVGYNGMPEGYNESSDLWERPTKYDHVIHAEVNAILNCSKTTRGAKIFVTLYPCKECAKIIAAAGIKEVYYATSEIEGRNYLDATSQKIFELAGIREHKI